MELESKDLILKAIHDRKPNLLKEIFETVPTIDIAEAMNEIEDVRELIYVFRIISTEYTGDLFAELSNEQQEKIINAFSDKDLIKLLENSFADDVVDTLEEMPANVVNRVLRVAPSDLRKDINQLLNYQENSAGSVMTTEFLEMKATTTVGQALKEIRQKGRDAETIYTIFVRDVKRNMVGTVDLDDLIFAEEDQTLEEIMNRDFITCNVYDDQEEVANKFKRYDLHAMGVVNNDNKLVGIITVDDVMDVIQQEAEEDIAALSHVAPLEDSYLETSIWSMAKKCIPWIIVLLILGTFTTMVLDRIEKAHVFDIVPVLIAFVPTLMDTGGNSGGQTIAMMIRGLSTNEFKPHDYFKIIRKEAMSALIISAIVSAFSFIWFMVEQYTGIVQVHINGEIGTIWNGNCWNIEFFKHASLVSLTVSLTLFAGSFLAKLVAVTLPLAVAALKKDPAVVAQPLLTTIIDVVSLLVYLGIATLAFSWL